MPLNVTLLRSSFDLVMERQPLLTARFYELLFERHPQAQALFHRRPPAVQQKMLQEALVAVLDHIEDASWLSDTLKAMGGRHVEYGVTDEMYDWSAGRCWPPSPRWPPTTGATSCAINGAPLTAPSPDHAGGSPRRRAVDAGATDPD